MVIGSVSALRPLLRSIAHVDRSQISFVTALRNAIGTVAPLAVGAATGHLLVGLTVSIGALNVALSDRPGPYHQRAGRMLLAGACGAVSVFVGCATGASSVLTVVLVALWGFAAGLLAALGPEALQIGLTSVVLLLVFGGQPAPPEIAAARAALILVGGALQAALAVAAWPVRRFGPQRAALAALFRQLAAYARAPSDPGEAPPATAEATAASTALAGLDRGHGNAEEGLRTLLDEAERIRLELLALADVRDLLRTQGNDEAAVRWIDELLDAAGEVLAALAGALATGRPPVGTTLPLRRIEAACRCLRHKAEETGGPRHVHAAARAEALSGQLRAAVEIATQGSTDGEAAVQAEAGWLRRLRLGEPLAILRANLTLRSAACRHAVRMAGCLAVADGLARSLALPWGYWVPLTAAIVLRPDFAATFTRGLSRVVGTMLGLVLATALVYTVFGPVPARVALVGVLVFAIRLLGPANFGLAAVAITALVVVLLSFADIRPAETIVDRGVDTCIGGALALLAYAVWPTWERAQAPTILADMLEAYRRYFAAVMAGYLDPQHVDAAGLAVARRAARLARSNAEASIDRLRSEPARSPEELDRAVGLLASSHRFVRSAMALEAGLYHDPDPPAAAPVALQDLVDAVDTTLRALIRALRDPSYRLTDLPDLHAAERALTDALGAAPAQDGRRPRVRYRDAVLASEAERVTDSVDTMAGLLQRPAGTTRADPGRVAT